MLLTTLIAPSAPRGTESMLKALLSITSKEVVHADSADEAFEIISKKYNRERIISVRERSNP